LCHAARLHLKLWYIDFFGEKKTKETIMGVKLVLVEDVQKLGESGDLVEVAPGYARNYLIPKGYAQKATPGLVKAIEVRKAKERARLAALREAAIAKRGSIEALGKVIIYKQVGENDSIFGTVTNQDVADALKTLLGEEIDRREITLDDNINAIGTYGAKIRLAHEVFATIRVEVAAA
jgi:large subunit ribosomal protein L9